MQGLPVIGPGPWSDSYTGYSAGVGERKPGIVEREDAGLGSRSS